MKTIGILGGMSPESTVSYYKALNRLTKERLGGYASAKIILHSVNFAETHAAQIAGDWGAIGEHLAQAAQGLEAAGAELMLLATNTMHKCASMIEAELTVPFLHIADTCANALRAADHHKPILLGTAFTMEETFYTERLIANGLSPIIPTPKQRSEIHRIIFDELVHGVITDSSRQTYIDVVSQLAGSGADSVILGCTEIGMLLNAGNCPLPPFDTAELHCRSAIAAAL